MSENKKILATPKIRKFARLLGANIYKIEGSARAGRITEEDVKNFVNKNLNKSQSKEKKQFKLINLDKSKTLNIYIINGNKNIIDIEEIYEYLKKDN